MALYSEVLLKYRDKEKYHITVYFSRQYEDEDAGRLREYVDKWVNVYYHGAGDAARMMVEDEIDILVELTGHTAQNRLDILACRAAPIQVTWIGYPNTTGLDYIHYRVTDALTDPVDTTQPFAVLCLPTQPIPLPPLNLSLAFGKCQHTATLNSNVSRDMVYSGEVDQVTGQLPLLYSASCNA